MALSIGIVGMPNVGKSTLFNALTQAGAQMSNYAFTTIDRNVGVVEVPDERLQELNRLLSPEECIPTTIQFVDIAGLVEGASRGEGLGNKFLGHIREVDAVAHVVRCFEDERVVRTDRSIDPSRDAEIVNAELALADLETAEKGLQRWQKIARSDAKLESGQIDTYRKVKDRLEQGMVVRGIVLSDEEMEIVTDSHFLTLKPLLYVANVAEDDPKGEGLLVKGLRESLGENKIITPISAKMEEEISELPDEEREEFLFDLGLEDSCINRFILEGYKLLKLITFYTTANNKLRAWQLTDGTSAPDAAGNIHSDMQQRFIKAEVASYEDLKRHGSMAELQRTGLVKIEGKDYKVRDGDVMHFMFGK